MAKKKVTRAVISDGTVEFGMEIKASAEYCTAGMHASVETSIRPDEDGTKALNRCFDQISDYLDSQHNEMINQLSKTIAAAKGRKR